MPALPADTDPYYLLKYTYVHAACSVELDDQYTTPVYLVEHYEPAALGDPRGFMT